MSNRKQLEVLIDDSYHEFVSLLKWFSLFGPIPTIIGGWAVYFYNSYFGSIDIDIVSPSHQGRFIDLIERYQRTHRYEFVEKGPLGLEVTTRKPVVKNGKIIGYMEIDACIAERHSCRCPLFLWRTNNDNRQSTKIPGKCMHFSHTVVF